MLKRILYFSYSFVLLLLIALVLCACLLEGSARVICCIVFGAAIALWGGAYILPKSIRQYKAARLMEKEGIFERYAQPSVATALCDARGRIYWASAAFSKLCSRNWEGRNVFKLIPGLDKPDKRKRIELKGVAYKKEISHTRVGREEYILVQLLNLDKPQRASSAQRMTETVACYISVDNYEGITARLQQVETSAMDSQIDKLVSSFSENMKGLLLKYAHDKYLVCFQQKYLVLAQQTKFKLLDEVRALTTTEGMNPTLSIAVGVGTDPQQSEIFARKAMELAQGRGGDQAVVKDADGYLFYGGVQRAVEVNSRVRSRSVAKALHNLMDQCDQVLIMGHENSDLDCLGSAMGLVACARSLGKPAHIVLDHSNSSIDATYKRLRQECPEVLISGSEARQLQGPHCLLIVVDTQIRSYTAAPFLLDHSGTLVLIDHHLRGTSIIEGADLFYHEPYASSASEMVTEIVQYFSDSVKLTALEADTLLSGIMMDTKGFSFKTGVRTFEAAGYLRRVGANTGAIRQLFQDDFNTFTSKAAVVREAHLLPGGIAVSICPKDSSAGKLIAAQAADALVGIRGIEASFVLSEAEGCVNISGRSLGSFNVQLILEKMGGGGHAGMAGAQIHGKTAEQVKKQLLDLLEQAQNES